MNRGRSASVFGVLVSLVAMSCSSNGEGPRSVSTADAYTAAIRWFVDTGPGTVPTDLTIATDATATDATDATDPADADPVVVYVAPADGNPIDAGAQAAVIAELADMADSLMVVFADMRDDAIDLDLEGQPVKEDGVLLLVGKVAEGPPPVDVSIEVYRNVSDDESFLMRIVRAGPDDYTVTAVTQLEQS